MINLFPVFRKVNIEVFVYTKHLWNYKVRQMFDEKVIGDLAELINDSTEDIPLLFFLVTAVTQLFTGRREGTRRHR